MDRQKDLNKESHEDVLHFALFLHTAGSDGTGNGTPRPHRPEPATVRHHRGRGRRKFLHYSATPSIDTTNRPRCLATKAIKKVRKGIMCVWANSGMVDPGCRITLTKKLGEQGGGHGHAGADRPLGTLSRSTGMGEFEFDYEAPEVSGIVNIVATSVDSGGRTTEPFTFKMKVQTNGLVELPPSAEYRFVGNPLSHSERFWGTPQLITALTGLARDYHAAFPDHTLGYNDMNLPLGGLFDLNDDWSEPHCGHRGNNADLRTKDIRMDRLRNLRLLIRRNGLLLLDETKTDAPHFHLAR